MDNKLEQFVRDHAGEFDTRMPDPAVLERIQRQMKHGVAPVKRGVLVPMRTLRVAAACLIVLAGLATYWIINHTDARPAAQETAQQLPPVTKHDVAPGVANENSQPVETLPSQVATAGGNQPAMSQQTASGADYRQVIFAGLQDMEAPSQRLIAAAKVFKMNTIDRDIIDVLSNTLNSDPNTNVRLAALDALGKFRRESYVKSKLVESLKKQNDPMVQIALIDMLTVMRERKIVDQLDKIVNDAKTMDAVKDHAYTSLFTLRS